MQSLALFRRVAAVLVFLAFVLSNLLSLLQTGRPSGAVPNTGWYGGPHPAEEVRPAEFVPTPAPAVELWQPRALPQQQARLSPDYTASAVSAPGIFSFPILQQPEDEAAYVSRRIGQLTQFRLASQNGVTGLLAHNYLSGKEFYRLEIGQEIRVMYSDQHEGRYQVASIHHFQKVQPSKLYSDYLDLETRQRMSSTQVFERFYSRGPQVTFQTCLENEGRLDWGILLVIASPVDP